MDQYALPIFEVSERHRAAEVATKKATGHDLDIATAWHSRVLQWSENIGHDLRSDAVPAPRGLDAHWTLYIPKTAPPQSATFTGECAGKKLEVADSISCDVCIECAQQFSKLIGPALKKVPAPIMPLFARPIACGEVMYPLRWRF